MKFLYKLSLPTGAYAYCANGAEMDGRIQAELRDAARLGYKRTMQDFKVEVIELKTLQEFNAEYGGKA